MTVTIEYMTNSWVYNEEVGTWQRQRLVGQAVEGDSTETWDTITLAPGETINVYDSYYMPNDAYWANYQIDVTITEICSGLPSLSRVTFYRLSNESTAVLATSKNSSSAMAGRMLRSMPTIAPTNAFTIMSSINCVRFSRSPSATRPCSLGDTEFNTVEYRSSV